ncbi:glutamine--fructose-6-phosphate transaminase (isomerizing) [Roseicyclus mahoneyensis]|uniref:Glutamine--fructose-6-phosphate aminotransferase [isomerizing] n=1 Tax=Roseicyclus mahoneyensis TaxID=164332 RepID=A0A316GIX5_9RHOB|nr:glutamine--fructose-6-phosphate transaminase (isomerizing) [Roseicyclus mahoneyensis]PWK60730.1 glutamine--fructose-6-phosphate transaminase [Roseicyclus mahoneyensis]
MCGIVGILGTHEVAPLILEALKRLEYRGYDSAGIATLQDGHLDRRRAVGKLINLSDRLVHEPLPGKAGIGHTRWATHGAPTEANAHPHQTGPVAVVHNGIIENYRGLRAELSGSNFESETDTETVAHLCARFMAQGMDPRAAAVATIARLEGAFALCFLFHGEEDLIIAARKGSPLAIGHGEGEMFVGSDAIALAPMTEKITYLDEGDYAFVTRAGAEVFAADGTAVTRPLARIERGAAVIDKAGYKHFMAKEIHEQPVVFAEAMARYAPGNLPVFPEALDFTRFDRVVLVACGTGYYSCLTAKYWFEQVAGLPCEVDVASEFRYREPPVAPRTLALFVSQSGETADTLAALRYMRGRADLVASLVNVGTSSIARESDVALAILAGIEVSVASTKAYVNQLGVLAMLALHASHQRGAMTAPQIAAELDALRHVPDQMRQVLALEPEIARIARGLAEAKSALFLGRGVMYATALEAALKLKELSYIHAEAYASGELKHGPIALIDRSLPVLVIAPHDGLFDKTVSNMQEVMARGGPVTLITDSAGAAIASEGTRAVLVLPLASRLTAPMLYAIPAQLLAYHTAIAKGTDVDQPRNLAKSVTVE